MREEKRRGGIILQVAVLFALGILITGIVTFMSQYRNSYANVKLQAEVRSAEIAEEVDLAVREYPAFRWLLSYWHENAEQLDIEYDADYGEGTKTEEKYRTFKERNPGTQLKYIGPQEIRALPEEDQKLYAEICYSWLINRIDQIKHTHQIDYLFCVLTDPPYDTQFFLFSGAEPGAVRGTNYEEVYTLGTTVHVGESQQEAMRSALRQNGYLANAGGYVDYYSFLCNLGDHKVLIGMTYSLSRLAKDVDALAWRGTAQAMSYQLVLSVLCLMLIYYYVLKPLKSVQENIRLYKNTKDSKTVESNLAEVKPRNEIGQLSEDVIELTAELDQHMAELETITAEKERITTELSLATRLQTAFIPHVFPPFPDRHEFELYASMDPAREVGGDFYDFFLSDEDHLGLVIADVSGKGVPAALFMMASKIILQSYAAMGMAPAEILTRTNEAICANNEEEMFVTAWVGILELSTGRLTAANAGHEYPAVKKPDGQFELLKDKHGFVIGGMSGAVYKEYELQLEPGSKVFVYTDGVPEAMGGEAAREMFGTGRMLEALNNAPKAHPKEIVSQVRGAMEAFVKDAEQFDDITMLCVEYRGEKTGRPERSAASPHSTQGGENHGDQTESGAVRPVSEAPGGDPGGFPGAAADAAYRSGRV